MRLIDCDKLSYELQKETKVNWKVFDGLTFSFAKLNATNEKARKVMNVLGFELVDEKEMKNE